MELLYWYQCDVCSDHKTVCTVLLQSEFYRSRNEKGVHQAKVATVVSVEKYE